MNIFVDTEIWSIAQKKPNRAKFPDDESYREALRLHRKARELIRDALRRHVIYMSYHQICEIYHVLGFRGSRLPLDRVQKFILAILASKKIVKIPVNFSHIVRALELSTRSGIHLWDFLCLLPVIEYIEVAYSMDKHFRHPVFKKLGIRIENPLGTWIVT